MPQHEIAVPDIGDFRDVEVIEVLVGAGDRVAAEDSLITLESDKATMDVPSPRAGTIVELKTNVGDRVSEGSVIALIESAAETAAEPDAARPEPQPAPAVSMSEVEDAPAAPVEPVRRPPPSLPPPMERSGGALPHASPGVRRFARELGADLAQVRGTGLKGRILKEDVREFIKGRLSDAPAAATGGGVPPLPEIDFSRFGAVESGELPRIRKISGAHLHRAWLNVPHVTHHDEADVTELENFRRDVNAEQAKRGGAKVTLLAFAVKALARCLMEFPLFNSSLNPAGDKLIYKKYFHVGIAVDTPHGLVVPVLRAVDGKGVLELASEMAETSARARDGKLGPEEMQGGSMTISSLGGIGGVAFTPIINAPEVALLGLSRSRTAPAWDGGQFVPRLMLPLSLSYDHRVIDGAEAARFCAFLAGLLNDPRRLLL